MPLATQVHVVLPRTLAIAGLLGGAVVSSDRIGWVTPTPSTLRLQQLLAQLGYLPLGWRSSATDVPRTAAAQAAAATAPPTGFFSWRYRNTPAELVALWRPGHANMITRGAVMTFEQANGLAVDGIAGPMVWHALLGDVIAGHRHTAPYSYVYVHQRLPSTSRCGAPARPSSSPRATRASRAGRRRTGPSRCSSTFRAAR